VYVAELKKTYLSWSKIVADFTPQVSFGILGNPFCGHGNFLKKFIIKENVPKITPNRKPEINILMEN
jgi:hypothetical protein